MRSCAGCRWWAAPPGSSWRCAFARERAALPAALAVLGGLAFVAIGIAGLSLLGRYLFLPAAMLCIFFGFAALGWIGRPLDGPWRAWVGGAAVLLVAFAGSTVSHQTDRLDRLRDGIQLRGEIQDDLRDLTRVDAAEAAFERCKPGLRAEPPGRADPGLVPRPRARGLSFRAARGAAPGSVRRAARPMSSRRSSSSTRATRSGSTSRASRRASGPWPRTSRGRCTSAGASPPQIQMDRAPVFENGPPGVSAAIWLRPGGSAAHGEDRLRLLPSGSDLVHGTPSRGTWPSTPPRGVLTLKAEPLDGNSAPLERIAGYRAPLAPRLARSTLNSRAGSGLLGRRLPPAVAKRRRGPARRARASRGGIPRSR